MSSLFGYISGETHAFSVIETKPTYEVRSYAAGMMIEAPNEKNDAFNKLAGYIGVMAKAENATQTKIAMTSPVVTTNDKKMQFVLPAAITEPPAPTNEAVTVVPKGAEKAVVATYYGSWNEGTAVKKKDDLVAAAKSDGLEVDETRWEWRRHNPPWTLPWYKKNEVYVPVKS
ncbi:hypothetical protein CTAYLR_001880 [Chrysophaeum taylorii]|uniref:SOUL heme-binding protein n=1 Tax=Chrysophaeum taylorii TaxID=2483200 RepID=A0AAD7XJ51_9STRA|nr:hypothetical protein CTAYLR_001880 [Chrysophaeum taylorii]